MTCSRRWLLVSAALLAVGMAGVSRSDETPTSVVRAVTGRGALVCARTAMLLPGMTGEAIIPVATKGK